MPSEILSLEEMCYCSRTADDHFTDPKFEEEVKRQIQTKVYEIANDSGIFARSSFIQGLQYEPRYVEPTEASTEAPTKGQRAFVCLMEYSLQDRIKLFEKAGLLRHFPSAYNTLKNPFFVLFNPILVREAVQKYLQENNNDLNKLFALFSDNSLDVILVCLDLINNAPEAIQEEFLKHALIHIHTAVLTGNSKYIERVLQLKDRLLERAPEASIFQEDRSAQAKVSFRYLRYAMKRIKRHKALRAFPFFSQPKQALLFTVQNIERIFVLTEGQRTNFAEELSRREIGSNWSHQLASYLENENWEEAKGLYYQVHAALLTVLGRDGISDIVNRDGTFQFYPDDKF